MTEKSSSSRPLLFGIFVAVAIIAITLYTLNNKGVILDSGEGTIEDVTAGLSFAEVVDGDTDSDGVPDWQEVLWGTDPENPYSTDPHVSDKEYVDAQKATFEGDFEELDPEELAELNETERFSREFFQTVVALQQSGNLTEENIVALSGVISGELLNQELPEPYRETQLTTTETTLASLALYRDTLVRTLDVYAVTDLGTELEVLDRALVSEDRRYFDDLLFISQEYQEIADNLAAIPIPDQLSGIHTALANGYAQIAVTVGYMSASFDNPLQAVVAIKLYDDTVERVGKTVENITALLDS